LSGAQILESTRIIDQREIGDVVIERVDGEVAPQRVFLDGAIEVVAHDQAIAYLAIGVRIRVVVRAAAAEGRDLDDVASEMHMRQAETAPDQATVAKDLAHLFGRGVGGNVEVLGLVSKEQIAHPAAHQMGLEVFLPEPVEHAQRLLADVGARDVVLGTRHHAGLSGTDWSGMGVGVLHEGLRGCSLSSIVQKPLV
jgi:hypothetical protein